MIRPRKPDILGTFKRLIYVCVGLGLSGLGLFRRVLNGEEIALWRRALTIAGGLFFVYCGSMYYFPKNRRRRAELDARLDDYEREP